VGDGQNIEGMRGEGKQGMVWGRDGAELGSSSRELRATAEELVWRRKTKGRGKGEREKWEEVRKEAHSKGGLGLRVQRATIYTVWLQVSAKLRHGVF
jgi:hypothetical protein